MCIRDRDTLTKIMIVSQDMGQQHELENLANTDALTGLFNKRCLLYTSRCV